MTIPFAISQIPHRALIDAMPVPCALSDAAGNFILLNKPFVEIFGYSIEEISTMSAWHLKAYPDPKYREWVTQVRAGMLAEAPSADQAAGTAKVKIRSKNGRDLDVVVHGAGLGGAAPGIFLVTFRDVTEQRRSQEKSEELLQRLEWTEEIAGIGGWDFDPQTGDVNWTRGTYLIHDVDPACGRANMQKYLDVMRARLPAKERDAFLAAIANGQTGDEEVPITTAQGREIWVHTRGRAIMEGGKVVRLVGHTQDITARRLAEDRNAELMRRLERTEEVARIGGWEHDGRGLAVTWTSGTYLIHDLDPADQIGFENYLRERHENPNPALAAASRTAMDHGIPWDLEIPVTTAKDRKIWIHTRGKPLIKDGKIVAVVGHDQDITARKASEDQLRAAQKMETVGQLTAGIAHDFNNLLAVITANLELLEEAVLNQPLLKRRVLAALKASERGADLTQHLLAFGRNQALTPKLCDLRNQVESSARLLKRTLPGNIRIQVEESSNPVWALLDASQFENALLNMGLNARDAMPKGGELLFSVGVTDSTGHVSEGLRPGRYAVITIRDNGAGMTPDTMARAFDPFFTTKAIGQGSGMGLSMVYGFVRQSGGHVQVTSAVGMGTTFTLQFPMADAASSENKALAAEH